MENLIKTANGQWELETLETLETLEKTTRSKVPDKAVHYHTDDKGTHYYHIKNKDGRKIGAADFHPDEDSPGFYGASEKHWGSAAENKVSDQIMSHARNFKKSLESESFTKSRKPDSVGNK